MSAGLCTPRWGRLDRAQVLGVWACSLKAEMVVEKIGRSGCNGLVKHYAGTTKHTVHGHGLSQGRELGQSAERLWDASGKVRYLAVCSRWSEGASQRAVGGFGRPSPICPQNTHVQPTVKYLVYP